MTTVPDSHQSRDLAEQTEALRIANRTLLESEQRLRLALETGRIGLWVWNSTDVSNAGDWSPRLKEIFGLPLQSEVTHEMFLECVHPEDRERVNASVLQALAGADSGSYSCEYRAIRPTDGALRWVTARGQAFFDGTGRPLRFIGTVMDITERKSAEDSTARLNLELERGIAERTADLDRMNKALQLEIEERKRVEETLRRSQNSLAEGQRLTKTGTWILDFPTGNTDWSVETCRIFGFPDPPPSPHYSAFRERVHPDDRDDVDRGLRESFQAGEPRPLRYRFILPGGEQKFIETISEPVKDSAGAVVRLIGTIMDVTERRTAEDALKASEILARGQLHALTRTLEALATESEPDRFLDHVLRIFVRQLDAKSLGVWELNSRSGRMELVGDCEEDRVNFAAEEERNNPSLGVIPPEQHPLWSEFFRSGERCVIGDLAAQPPVIRLDDSPTWHAWLSSVVANPTVVNMQQRLIDSGVVATLCVPLVLAGRVRGLISLRFKEPRHFATHDLELARALAHQAMLAIQLVRLSARSRVAAVTAERNRLARDIHDTMAQGFTGVIVQLEAAEDAHAHGLRAAAVSHVERARELARESLSEARRSVHALRPHALETGDLCAALRSLFEKMSAGTGVQAEFRSEGAPRKLPAEVEENLLRVGQEVFTNVLRHAHARHFTAWLLFADHRVQMEFSDDGRGFDRHRSSDGFGLIGMEERIREMGGQITIQSTVGGGTAISIALAIPDEAAPATS